MAADGRDSIPAGARQSRVLEARDLAMGGLLGALGIVVPMVFHAAGLQAGPIFLPMYLPILAAGLLISWRVALPLGILTPLLSSALTRMPPIVPAGVLMVFELGALAAVASICRQKGLGIWPSSILAIVAARIAGMLIYAAFGSMLGVKVGLWVWASGAIVTSLPGIALQLTVVPAAVYAIERTSIIGPRWPAQRDAEATSA